MTSRSVASSRCSAATWVIDDHRSSLGDRQQREHCAALRPAHLDRVAADHEPQRPEYVHPDGGVLGAIGAVAWGVAPLAVGPLGIDALGVLFAGGIFWTAWFVVVGARALALRRSPVLGAPTAPSGA